MPGSRSNSPLGRAVGAAVALLAVALLALNRWTDLSVPYGYDSVDILSALKGEDSHDPVPLGWDGYGL